MRDVRLKRISELVQRKASEVILYELKDPRMGFVTVTRVKLSGDLRHAVIYFSVVGTDGERPARSTPSRTRRGTSSERSPPPSGPA